MRSLCAALVILSVLGITSIAVRAQDYNSCEEQFYDSKDEPCGGGHQHAAGKRDEISLDLSRHRHRYLEDQVKMLSDKVAKLSEEVEALKKSGAK